MHTFYYNNKATPTHTKQRNEEKEGRIQNKKGTILLYKIEDHTNKAKIQRFPYIFI